MYTHIKQTHEAPTTQINLTTPITHQPQTGLAEVEVGPAGLDAHLVAKAAAMLRGNAPQ